MSSSSSPRTRSASNSSTSGRSGVSPRSSSRSNQVKLLEALALDGGEDHHGLSKHIFHWPQRTNKHGETHPNQQQQPRIVVEKRFVKNHHNVHQPGGAANCNRY